MKVSREGADQVPDLVLQRLRSDSAAFPVCCATRRASLRPIVRGRLAGSLLSTVLFAAAATAACAHLSTSFGRAPLQHLDSLPAPPIRLGRPAGPAFAPVPMAVDPALLAVLLQAAFSRAAGDLERVGLGPPRGGSSRVVYRNGRVCPASPTTAAGAAGLALAAGRLGRRPGRRLVRACEALKRNPVNGTATLVRTAALAALRRQVMEEEPVEAAVLDELGEQAVEQVGAADRQSIAYLFSQAG